MLNHSSQRKKRCDQPPEVASVSLECNTLQADEAAEQRSPGIGQLEIAADPGLPWH